MATACRAKVLSLVNWHKRTAGRPFERQQALGGQDGLIQFTERSAGEGRRNFLSSSSLGWGVSFSRSAVKFINHLYDDQHRGLRCALPTKTDRRLLDFSDKVVREAMQAAQVLLPDFVKGLAFPGNTLYVRPRAFEEAAFGHVVVSAAGANADLVYTDKGLLDYQQACVPIAVENFPCEDWGALLQNPQYVGGDNGEAGVAQRYLAAGEVNPSMTYARRIQKRTEECGRRNGQGQE